MSCGLTPVHDTDSGVLDGDSEYDRTVGVLQFLPATWATAGHDGNGDEQGTRTTPTTPRPPPWSCSAAAPDLDDPLQLTAALLAYNNSATYVAEVKEWITTPTIPRRGASPPSATSPSPPEPAG